MTRALNSDQDLGKVKLQGPTAQHLENPEPDTANAKHCRKQRGQHSRFRHFKCRQTWKFIVKQGEAAFVGEMFDRMPKGFAS